MSIKARLSVLPLVVALLLSSAVFLFRETSAQDRLPAPTIETKVVGNTIEVTWSAVEGAVRYNLYRWRTEKWDKLDDGNLTDTQFTDPNVEVGVDYWYAVRAVDSNGVEGDPTQYELGIISALPLPEYTTLTATGTSIHLAWTAVEGAARYKLYYRQCCTPNQWFDIGGEELFESTFLHTGLSRGIDYQYAVRPKTADDLGTEWVKIVVSIDQILADMSATATAQAINSGAPIAPTATATTAITVTATATGTPTPFDNTSMTGTPTIVPEGTTVPTATRRTVTGVTGPGRVVNTPTRTPTPTPTATPTLTPSPTVTPTPLPTPGSISWGSYSSTHNTITVTWSTPDPPAQRYELRMQQGAPGAGYFGPFRTWHLSDPEYTAENLDANKPYSFWVRGYNGNASGPRTYSRTVRTKIHPDNLAAALPAAPGNLTASYVADGIKLSWTPDPARTGYRLDEGDVYEHQIERRRSANTRWQVISLTGRNGSYTDKNVHLGNTYTYRVRARNIHGLGSAATVTHTHALPTATPTPTAIPAPTATPTNTPVPCSEVTCPSDCEENCSPDQKRCGCEDCRTSCVFCGVVWLSSLSVSTHMRLHEMMEYDEAIGVLLGIKWAEDREDNERALQGHPYFLLYEER